MPQRTDLYNSAEHLTGPHAGFRNTTTGGPKKRNVDRACDACRRRKTRCDGPKQPNNICSNCAQNKKACTYLEASKPRGPPKSYVTGLEDKLERMEALLHKLRPGEDFSAELGPPVVRDSWKDPESFREVSESHSHLPPPQPSSTFASQSNVVISSGMSTQLKFNRRPPLTQRHDVQEYYADSQSSESDHSDEEQLVDRFEEGMQRLTLNVKQRQLDNIETAARFHGPSSNLMLVDATRKFKNAHLMTYRERQSASSDSSASTASPASDAPLLNSSRRAEYWNAPKWELVYEGLHVDSPKFLHSVLEQFPEPTLAEELIGYYFQHVNPQFSLLNKRMFYRQWRERLYENDIWFCALSMCIFALGSRWSHDLRVLPRDHSKQESHELDWTKAGWCFFEIAIGVHRARRGLLYTATLAEVQTFALLAWFLRGTTEYAVGWLLSSVGLRKAMDVGAQRKAVYSRKLSADEELWKRAFWVLVVLDRTGSSSLGRSCSIAEEDFDLELPLEVDDEYWDSDEPPSTSKQPSGVPSRVTALNVWIHITQIVAFVVRTLYMVDPEKMFLGRQTLPDTQSIVEQLNFALSEWLNSVPEHLQWPNQTGNPIFSNQSCSLFLSYHFCHILIYRTFIPFSQILPPSIRGLRAARSSEKPGLLSDSALTICVNSAKACARIIEGQMGREFSNVPFLISIANVCAAILIVHLWELKGKEMTERGTILAGVDDVKPQHAITIQSIKDDVDFFIHALEWAEPRYPAVAPMLADLRASFPDLSQNSSERDFRLPPSPSDLPGYQDLPPLWRWEQPLPVVLSNAPPSSFGRDWDEPPRTSVHPALGSSSFPERFRPIDRRESGPTLGQSPAETFWSNTPPPPPSQTSAAPSLKPLPSHRHPTHPSLHNLVSHQETIPYANSVRPSPRSAEPRYGSASPSDYRDSLFYNYSPSSSDYGRAPHQHLPTSDARSMPTAPMYNKQSWNESVYPRGNNWP